MLKALANMSDNEKVCVSAKVVHLEKSVKAPGGFTKQDITIADATSASRIALWEAEVRKRKVGKCYRLHNVVIQSYQQSEYLSVPKEDASIVDIGDIDAVAEDDLPEDFVRAEGVTVAGVLSLQSYLSCLQCKCKVNVDEEGIGKCTKCNMQQRTDLCRQESSARLLVSIPGGEYLTLNTFESNVSDIAQCKKVTAELLPSASPFDLTYKTMYSLV